MDNLAAMYSKQKPEMKRKEELSRPPDSILKHDTMVRAGIVDIRYKPVQQGYQQLNTPGNLPIPALAALQYNGICFLLCIII